MKVNSLHHHVIDSKSFLRPMKIFTPHVIITFETRRRESFRLSLNTHSEMTCAFVYRYPDPRVQNWKS